MRSFKLARLRLFCWGPVEDEVSETYVYNVMDLKQKITTEIRTLSPEFLNNTSINLGSRFCAVI